MPIDTSLYGRLEAPDAGNFLQAMAAGQQIRQQQTTNRLQAMQAQQAQTAMNDDQRLRDAYKINTKDGQQDYDGIINYLANNGGGTQIPGVIKARQDAIQQHAALVKTGLDLQKHLSAQVMANPTPETAMASLDRMESIFGPGSMSAERQALAALGNDPKAIAAWANYHAVDAEKLLPQFATRDIGGTVQTVSRNPATGEERVIASVSKTMTPGELATAQSNQAQRQMQKSAQAETQRHNKATEQLRAQGAGMTLLDDEGGIVGQGQLSSNGQALIDAIGTYQISPRTALARVQPAVRAQIIAGIRQQYPAFDETRYDAKSKAARDFTTGTLGNTVRSVGTADAHLAQLDELVDALGNGNTPLFNSLANRVAANLGSAAPTNFDAAKQIVGKEVVKAIVANGGGVSEREEIDRQLSNAKTPAQLQGIIKQYRQLFGAQYQNLLEQRRAAGLPEDTVPNYAQHGSQQGQQRTQPAKAAASTQTPYQNYLEARQRAMSRNDLEFVKRLDAEALKDGVIRGGK